MYFYKVEKNGRFTYRGPYILGREELLEMDSVSSHKFGLSAEDREYLESAFSRAYRVHDSDFMELYSRLEIRDSISSHEYDEAYKYYQQGVELDEWLMLMGINQNQHWNLKSGRSKVPTLIAYKVADMLINHSYILESTGFLLSTMEIDGVRVLDYDQEAFGLHSPRLLQSVRNSYSLQLTYYWGRRTHHELCQAFVYMKTHDSRQATGDLSRSHTQSPEYFASSLKLRKQQKKKQPELTPVARQKLLDSLSTIPTEAEEPARRELASSVLKQLGYLSDAISLAPDVEEKLLNLLQVRDMASERAYLEHSMGAAEGIDAPVKSIG